MNPFTDNYITDNYKTYTLTIDTVPPDVNSMNISIHQVYKRLTNTIYNVLEISPNDITLNYCPDYTHLSISNRIYHPGSEIYVTSSVRCGDSIELLLYYPSIDSNPRVRSVTVVPAKHITYVHGGKVISVDDSDELYNASTRIITLLDFNNNSPRKIAEDLYNKLYDALNSDHHDAFPIIEVNITDTTVNTINVYIKYRTTDSHGDAIYTSTQPIELSNKDALYLKVGMSSIALVLMDKM